MTDRHNGYIVTLERPIREDDAEAILNALKMVKGVLSVKPLIESSESHIAEQRVRRDFELKILNMIYGDMQ